MLPCRIPRIGDTDKVVADTIVVAVEVAVALGIQSQWKEGLDTHRFDWNCLSSLGATGAKYHGNTYRTPYHDQIDERTVELTVNVVIVGGVVVPWGIRCMYCVYCMHCLLGFP